MAEKTRELCPTCLGSGQVESDRRYIAEVKSAIATIKERGRIWEGCRPAFESGKHKDETLARMIREGVIVPASEPTGGYVLPPLKTR